MPAPYSLFLDDRRRPPDDGDAWVLCRTVDKLVATVQDRGIPRHASFDYQLDETDPAHTGFDALEAFIDTLMAENGDKFRGAVKIRLHTSSRSGKQRMRALMEERRAECAAAGIDLIDDDPAADYWRRVKG